MINSVNYLDISEKINPSVFSQYLESTGWTLFPGKRQDLKIFQYERDADLYQVVIPEDKTLRDYKDAMYQAVRTVSIVENKPVEQILLFLLNPGADILKIRLDKRDMEMGSIPFDDAICLYENAKKLLAAAALDILHPELYHQGRIEDTVSRFLSDCRFGQTQVGSYVVSVVCPFAEIDENHEYRQLSFFSDEKQCAESLTRQVTSRIMNNISIIKKSIDKGGVECLTDRNEENPISVNFYEALKGLNFDFENTNMEFTAEWSPVVKNTYCYENSILFTHDYFPLIEETIKKLHKGTPKSAKIIGRVKKLESSPDIEKRTMGKVSVVYLDGNNKPGTVTVKLEKDDYDKAIYAHANGNYVELIGELNEGRKSTMICRSFRSID